MKLLVIGANGGVGRRVVQTALQDGHSVTALVVNPEGVDERATIVCKDLFALTKQDVQQYDAVISCFGSGFDCDPVINRDVCLHYIDIFAGISTRILHIIGSGSLFVDDSHTTRVYEQANHPNFLKGISLNATLGMIALQESSDVNYTVVTPSLTFENADDTSGSYRVGTQLQPMYNSDGNSYTKYCHLARAMVDFAADNSYNRQVVTVVSDK